MNPIFDPAEAQCGCEPWIDSTLFAKALSAPFDSACIVAHTSSRRLKIPGGSRTAFDRLPSISSHTTRLLKNGMGYVQQDDKNEQKM
jgi:hypothetical protein